MIIYKKTQQFALALQLQHLKLARLATLATMQQSMESENGIIKDITETHAPDGRDIDVKFILKVVEEIFSAATPTTSAQATSKESDEDTSKPAGLAAPIFAQFTYLVNQLSSEISYKCMIGAEGHSTTVSLFRMLSSYSWDAKLVLTLAAFALNYGEFFLHNQIYSTNKLARRMAILKNQPEFKHHIQLNPLVDAQNNLIKSMLDLVKCVVEFKELPTRYLSPKNAAFSAAFAVIPTASYWIIRSVIVCATNITYHNGTGQKQNKSSPEEMVEEVSLLDHEIKKMIDYLHKQLAICHHNVEERKHQEAYEALLHSLEDGHIDNMRSLKLLICPKDDLQPLFDGSTQKRVDIEVVKGKTVMLLVADVDVMMDTEIFILEQIYKKSRSLGTRVESKYNIIWVPTFNLSNQWTEKTQKDIESVQKGMQWLSLYDPRLIDQVLTRFINEKLQFKDRPILMVIDVHGKMVNPNALPMMYIWGNQGFPFSITREKVLWKEATWELELLIGDIDKKITTWISEEKHIILYGGDDTNWFDKFSIASLLVMLRSPINFEIIYLGKEKQTERIERILERGRNPEMVESEHLGHSSSDFEKIWLFWKRLQSMISSSNQLGIAATEENQALQEIRKLVENDMRDSTWAVYSKGGNIAINGSGTIFLSALQRFDEWEEDAKAKGFHVAFKEFYDKLDAIAHPGFSVEFPATDKFKKIPHKMKCPKCNCNMEKYVGFSCSHD